MTEKLDRKHALEMVEGTAIDLRLVLNDARAELDTFEAYVDSWDEEIAAIKADPATHDPRQFAEEFVITRALRMLDDTAHIHTGSGRASNWRRAQRRLVQLAKVAR